MDFLNSLKDALEIASIKTKEYIDSYTWICDVVKFIDTWSKKKLENWKKESASSIEVLFYVF